MKNFGIVLLLVGIFIFLNATNFRDVILGKAKLQFVNPKTNAPATTTTTTPAPINISGGSSRGIV